MAAISKETGEVRESVKLGSSPAVSEAPLKPGTYECWFVALDLLGNEYPSHKVEYEVLQDGTTVIRTVGGTRPPSDPEEGSNT